MLRALACTVLSEMPSSGEPIAHLFAAGTNSGGWLGPYYPGSGTCLQGTLNWGRIAGASAAKA